MTCSFAGSLLNDLLDRELALNTKKSLEEHLDVCPACRAEYQELARLKGMLAKIPVPEPGLEYWKEVSELILARTVEAETVVDRRPEIERRSRERSSFYRSVVAVAASLAVFVTSLWLGSSGPNGLPGLSDRSSFDRTEPAGLIRSAAGIGALSEDEQALIANGMLLVGTPGMFASPTEMAMILGLDRTR